MNRMIGLIIMSISITIYSNYSVADENTFWKAWSDQVVKYSNKTIGLYKNSKNTVITYFSNKDNANNIAIGSTVVAGSTAATVGTVTALSASSAATTTAIVAGGATAGGILGGVVGSGVGLASGGTAMAATIPFATGGATLGGSLAANAATLIGVGTAPIWAVPVAVAGGVVAVGGATYLIYVHYNKDSIESNVDNTKTTVLQNHVQVVSKEKEIVKWNKFNDAIGGTIYEVLH